VLHGTRWSYDGKVSRENGWGVRKMLGWRILKAIQEVGRGDGRGETSSDCRYCYWSSEQKMFKKVREGFGGEKGNAWDIGVKETKQDLRSA